MKKYFYLTVAFFILSGAAFSYVSAADVQLMGTDVFSSDANGPEFHTYSQYTASTTGVVHYITQYSSPETPASSTVWLGIYSDLDDTPYQLLGFGSSSYNIPQNSIKSVSITPVTLLAGTKYWVSAISNTGEGTHIAATSKFHYRATSTATFRFPETATTSGYTFLTSILYLYGVFGEATVDDVSSDAANLAKQLVNSTYLYGGKGWDYSLNQFVTPSTVTSTGYTYWNQASGTVAFGQGVDCSGLIMWAYNRSFDPNKSRFENFVKAENADGQFRDNTTSTTESQLQPGDAMFFDFDDDDFIDHVAMYVGESGGFDVVSAVDENTGIAPVSKDMLKNLPGFRGFKHVISALPPSVLVSAGSPVDLTVTDPDGFTITPTTIIPSDLEFLRQIPGVLYYSEMERGADGNPIDQVYSYTLKTGDYIIQVLPEPGTPSGATYTLDFSAGEQSITLAQDTPISQIPSEGYGVDVTETGTITLFVPVAIDIKPNSSPNSINLGSKGTVPVAIFGNGTFNVRQIALESVTLADAPIKLKNNEKFITNYKDINGDGFTNIVIHIITEKLQLTPSDTKAELNGFLFDGTEIKGSDSVKIVP